MFQQPSQGDRFNVSDHVGALVLIYARELRDGIITPFGDKEAIVADVHVLDGEHGGEIACNTLIFQGALIGALRAAVGGDPVLARIGQGVAKPGQNPPYTLNPFADADAALATGYIQRMKPGFQGAANGQAATAAPPPAAAPAPAATTVDISTLPPEVQELLRQTGAVA